MTPSPPRYVARPLPEEEGPGYGVFDTFRQTWVEFVRPLQQRVDAQRTADAMNRAYVRAMG
jgi:hypothetical protein